MIEIKHLSKRFKGQHALKAINLSLKTNETVVFIGPSGSGKSTLLRCINFLEEPSEGVISIDGKAITPSDVRETRKRIGMVFQHFNLFSHMNVLDNITYAPQKILGWDRTKAELKGLELLEVIGLKDKASAYPGGLSGGQKQRVAIVRALAMDPEVLLLDEPTSALDPEMVQEVLHVIRNLAQESNKTLLLNTHEMDFARQIADRVVFLEQGSIIAVGTPEAILDNPEHPRIQRFLEKLT